MTSKNKSQKDYSAQMLTSLNPYSDNFDFELWSREVRQQMLDVLQKRLVKSQTQLG
ncbi:MAG: hypothetical protein AB4372_13840 [Xenococcus sp. (in: cyanobacteria)]